MENQKSLKDEAIAYESKSCNFCGKKLKDSRSRMCRECWKMYYRENPNRPFGEKNINWKGNNVQYRGLHNWIRNHKPKPKFCEICKKNPPQQVANISGEYKRDINDFEWLCVRCHVYKDGTINNLFNHRLETIKLNQNVRR